ncbi:hypothetical protein AAKU64_003166, partial [Undibacterium sp. GrIS 1.8]
KIKPALLNHTFERKSIKITKSARYLGFMEGLQSDNDHVIKLTHTCYEQNRIYPSPLYLATIIRLLSKTD